MSIFSEIYTERYCAIWGLKVNFTGIPFCPVNTSRTFMKTTCRPTAISCCSLFHYFLLCFLMLVVTLLNVKIDYSPLVYFISIHEMHCSFSSYYDHTQESPSSSVQHSGLYTRLSTLSSVFRSVAKTFL